MSSQISQESLDILEKIVDDVLAVNTIANTSVIKALLCLKIGKIRLETSTMRDVENKSIRQQHAEWSAATFGNVGPVGPLKHLAKEALEAAAAPDDLSEWADMQFLLWDAQRRAGITDEQITCAMIEKLTINKARTWPDPKDGEPVLHLKI